MNSCRPGIGDHVQRALAISGAPGVIDPVLDAALPRLDEHRLVQGPVEGDHPDLRGVPGGGGDYRQLAAARAVQCQLEPLIWFLEHQHVGAGRRLHPVTPHLKRPVQLVGHQVEQVPGSDAPGHAGVAGSNDLRQVLAGPQVPDPEFVDLRPAGVGRPGEQGAVGAGLADPDLGVSGRRGHEVLIQQDLLGRVSGSRAQKLQIVAVLRHPRAIRESAQGPPDRVLGPAGIRPAALAASSVARPSKVPAVGVVVGALGGQVLVQRRLIRVAHPRVVVGDRLAVQFADGRLARRDRRRGQSAGPAHVRSGQLCTPCAPISSRIPAGPPEAPPG